MKYDYYCDNINHLNHGEQIVSAIRTIFLKKDKFLHDVIIEIDVCQDCYNEIQSLICSHKIGENSWYSSRTVTASFTKVESDRVESMGYIDLPSLGNIGFEIAVRQHIK